MDKLYTTVGKIEEISSKMYHNKQRMPSLVDICELIYKNNEYQVVKNYLLTDVFWSRFSDQEFIELFKQSTVRLHNILKDKNQQIIKEDTMLREDSDIFIYKNFNYVVDTYHSHNYLETIYAFRGNAIIRIENEMINLKEGQFCILLPLTKHQVSSLEEENFILNISIKQSTFDYVFFSLLSNDDALSLFFRNMFKEDITNKYLIFSTDNNQDIKGTIKNLVMENQRIDIYYNHSCISWMKILFSILLRNFGNTLVYSKMNHKVNISFILQYIQYNYRNLSLQSLAETFHYNSSYMSVLIKQYTGISYSDLIKKFRMQDAKMYLLNTEMTIQAIAETLGYQSVDHFSRTFKKWYKISPSIYRKEKHQK